METVVSEAKPGLFAYHFDVGNSSDGPIGFCARIVAENETAALARLRSLLVECVELEDDLMDDDDRHMEEYLNVYFNDAAITVADIDDYEPIVEEDNQND